MPRIARPSLLLVALWLAIVALPAARQTSGSDRLERAFVSGGKIVMDLSAGGYRIEGTSDADIRVRWHTRDPDDMERVRARLDVTGREAAIRLDGRGNNFRATIELPERSDIVLRLSAGEIVIRGIEGNKDIDMWAGDITVAVGEPNRYSRVETSVRAGDISASPFRVTKSGLFRSFTYDGKGPYRLRVKLMAGDLKLVR